MLHVDRLRMHLREARSADREAEVLGDQRDQLGRVAETAGGRRPLALTARRIAAQREDVLDPELLHAAEGREQLLARCADAGQVRHRLEAELAADASDQLERAGARRAARAVGDRHECRRVLAQLARRLPQVLHPLIRLRREELEREAGPPLLENFLDAHAGRLRGSAPAVGADQPAAAQRGLRGPGCRMSSAVATRSLPPERYWMSTESFWR